MLREAGCSHLNKSGVSVPEIVRAAITSKLKVQVSTVALRKNTSKSHAQDDETKAPIRMRNRNWCEDFPCH